MKIKLHIASWRGMVLGILCLFCTNSILFGQLTFTLSSDPLLVNERLSLDGVVLQIQNNSSFNGNVIIHIYSDRFQQKIIAKSQPLMIREINHTFNLHEIFSSTDFPWENEKSTTACFQIFSEKQNLPLGFSCSEITRVKEGKKPAGSKNKKRDFLDANVTYELEALPLSDTPVNHILDYNGTLRVKDIPIKFQGFFQRNKDPYLDYNLSNFSTFIDVDQWRGKVKEKADKKFQEQKDSLLSDFPDYYSMRHKKEYVDRVIDNPAVLQELDALDSLSSLVNDLGLASVEDLASYEDSLQQQLSVQKNKLIEQGDSTLTPAQRDALNERIVLLEKRIKHAQRLAKLAKKKAAYDNLLGIGNESQKYLQKADSITADLDRSYQEILTQPNKLNQYLRQHKLGSKYMYLLNHVSEFRFGNINPNYSRLVLQNSQIKGLSLGLEYGVWGIAGFRGNLRNSDLNLTPDTLSLPTKVIGTKISYARRGRLKNDFFMILANHPPSLGLAQTKAILGHTSIYELNANSTLEFELAWAMNDSGISTEEGGPNRWTQTLKSLAGVSNYSGATKSGKLTWDTEVEYYGPQYFDINNPFLVNNSLELSNNFRYSILKGLQLGLSTLYNKGNLWQTENPGRGQTISQGINVSYFHKKWPAVQYVFNGSKIDGANYSLNSLFHNINVSKNYAIKKVQLQSLFNTTYLDNDSPLDSIDSKLITIYTSQEIRLTKNMRAIAAFNYFNLYNLQDGRALDLSYELKIPFNFDRLNIDPGIKWISNSNFEQLGWSINVSWLILKDLSLNVFVNSLWLNGTINEFGIIKNEYTPHISGRINYRF